MAWIDSWFFSLDFPLRLAVAGLVIVLIAILAWWKRQLSPSGLIAAIIMGLASTMIGGFSSLSLYLFFLLSAAVIGRLSARISGLGKIHKKGGRRDWLQVLANGGPALAAMFLYNASGDAVFLVVFAASLGEACADTWASEIGVLSGKPPVSILTFTPVPRGLSGGVSLLGTSASLLCALLYALFSFSLYAAPPAHCAIVALSAFAGMLADSFLGATAQAHYYNEEEDLITEHSRGRDGRKLRLVRGIRFLDNDMVNLTSNVIAFLLCFCLCCLF